MSSASPRSTQSPKKEEHDAEKSASPTLSARRSDQIRTTAIPPPMNLDSNKNMADLQNRRPQVKTPEPRGSKERMNGHREISERSPSTPGHLAPFDWEEFESRYEEALADSGHQEQELLEEFEALIKYFNVWASAASVHDSERGVKRLQTRERYVKIAEQSLSQKKKHLTEVVRAFQSALALLSQS
ncbi:hypothetical protein B0T26DRAFT_736499 [Lasiosphaeria miniovina]|uniref:Uncharacterized protein n=1 Tax=Lasiosphaeria miniovina TaxID=1954250 RepID=A0AA40BG25_9PEZI|nr:uncharacterized protein B0T26DRAFT_736499 [Lasiosphaeria miniovina]KAK0733587.1 hypothetical protein B0T26DRAFT_736499 [Lasiosphaeria miniovina]